jgi:hypothetical protein
MCAYSPPPCRKHVELTSSTPESYSFSCSEAGFLADCEDIFSTFSGECIQYDSVLRKQVSAFGPDSGQTCFLFACVSVSRVLLARSENQVSTDGIHLNRRGDGCTGAVSGAITFPGVSNLQTINFNDEASSYK